jgi:hypothetical protein
MMQQLTTTLSLAGNARNATAFKLKRLRTNTEAGGALIVSSAKSAALVGDESNLSTTQDERTKPWRS